MNIISGLVKTKKGIDKNTFFINANYVQYIILKWLFFQHGINIGNLPTPFFFDVSISS